MSLPAIPPAKRRRLDQSTSTLSKPFRSPLRVDVNRQAPTLSPKQDDHSQNILQPPSNTTTASTSHPASSPLIKLPVLASPRANSSPTKASLLPLSSPTRPAIRNRQPRSPESIALQKTHTRLLQQLAVVRKSVDTAEQALKLESSTQDAELEALITKWRGVAREAAEELFRTAKDRVNKMGGLGAWRDRTRKRDEAWGADQESGGGFGSQEDEIDEESLTEEQRELLEGYRDEMKQERERYGDVRDRERDQNEEKKEEQKEKDDESFTMDMMLKQLNVDLHIIGYDATDQRWSD